MLIYHTIHIASLLIAPSHTGLKYKISMMFGLTYEDSLLIYERWRHQNLERSHDLCSAVGKFF